MPILRVFCQAILFLLRLDCFLLSGLMSIIGVQGSSLHTAPLLPIDNLKNDKNDASENTPGGKTVIVFAMFLHVSTCSLQFSTAYFGNLEQSPPPQLKYAVVRVLVTFESFRISKTISIIHFCTSDFTTSSSSVASTLDC